MVFNHVGLGGLRQSGIGHSGVGLAGGSGRAHCTQEFNHDPSGCGVGGQAGYLCLPLAQVGLPAKAPIVSLSSSCECIQPRLVKYFDSQDSMAPAIMLEYVGVGAEVGGDSVATEPQRTVANLGVIIEATLTDGVKHEFTVTMLHSYLTQRGAH